MQHSVYRWLVGFLLLLMFRVLSLSPWFWCFALLSLLIEKPAFFFFYGVLIWLVVYFFFPPTPHAVSLENCFLVWKSHLVLLYSYSSLIPIQIFCLVVSLLSLLWLSGGRL